MATASKSIQFVAAAQPFPQIETISQDGLTLLLSLRGRLHQLESQVETAEQSIKQRLKRGASVEPGDHSAKLETNFCRNVSWKSVVTVVGIALIRCGCSAAWIIELVTAALFLLWIWRREGE